MATPWRVEFDEHVLRAVDRLVEVLRCQRLHLRVCVCVRARGMAFGVTCLSINQPTRPPVRRSVSLVTGQPSTRSPAHEVCMYPGEHVSSQYMPNEEAVCTIPQVFVHVSACVA